jgi:microcystin-dependent protein
MDPTMSEIRLFAGNFAPLSWAFCNGQLMSIAENTALFSLLGTTYGGDGQVTFGLPDFRGRAAIGTGQGGGLSYYELGQMSGNNSVTLLMTNLPPHNHVAVVKAGSAAANSNAPANHYPASGNGVTSDSVQIQLGAYIATSAGTMNAGMVTVVPSGNNSPVTVTNPYLGLNYIIATEGIYPSRS